MVSEERSFTTPRGTTQSAEKVTYKISHHGIDLLQKASAFKRQVGHTGINITNVNGVTVIGDGNVVSANFTDLSRALSGIRDEIRSSDSMSDVQKLEVVADIDTLQAQLQKPKPSRAVVQALWSGIERVVTGAGFVELVSNVAPLIAPLL